jgi:hypothetical protein
MLQWFMTMMFFSAMACIHAMPVRVAPLKVSLEPQADPVAGKLWHTTHFAVTAFGEVSLDDVKKIAVIAETTWWVVQQHPLGLALPPDVPRVNIAIYADTKSYETAGGYAGTAGYYEGRKQRVMINGSHYFGAALRAGRGLPPATDEDILVHELVHLCMHGHMGRLPAWFTEGVAEYFACMHTGGGNFSFAQVDQVLCDHLHARYTADSQEIFLRPIAEISVLTSRSWLDYVQRLPEKERYHVYATGLLMTHYFIHGGTERRDLLMQQLRLSTEKRFLWMVDIPVDAAAISKALPPYWREKGLHLVWNK